MGDDALRPDDDTNRSVYESAYRTWWALWKQASSDPELPLGCLELDHIFPQHPYFPVGLDLDPSGWLMATSTWIPTSGCCDMPTFERHFRATPTIDKPTTILTTTDSKTPFQKSLGKEDSHLTVLVLAWAYALSARWTSIIPSAAPLEYTGNKAKWVGTCCISEAEASAVVQLGSVNDAAARWWAAVLAPGQGWKASIPHQRQRLLSPWATFLDTTHPILLWSSSGPASPALETCPPFEAAVQYISEYTALHAASEQNRAAFAAVLLLPLANFDRKKVSLPLPRTPLATASGPKPHGPIWGPDLRQFDRLLTLSCNAQGIKSILGSIFYEPDIPCTTCGAWLQGTFEFLHSIHKQDVDVLARMFFLRSPHLSFLWLGAIITGAHKNFLKKPRTLLLATDKIDLHEGAWTGTVVSFIQEPVSRLPHGANFISRANEWRLSYLSRDFLRKGSHHSIPIHHRA